jgi:hypothetical protein
MTPTRASQALLERSLPVGARVSTKGEAVMLSVHRGTMPPDKSLGNAPRAL